MAPELVDRLHGTSTLVWLSRYEQSALWVHWGGSHTTMTTTTTITSKVKRSSIPTIRSAMLERGALLFRFEKPTGVTHKQEHIAWFEQMQEVGLLVTTNGCILPYENFRNSSKGRPKGHKISAYYFLGGPPPRQEMHPHGWPTEMQVSHRCHRKDCVSPLHVIWEPQWKNLKRNYCGADGSCDCGMTPPCVATYHNDGWQYDDEIISYSTDGYRRQVADLLSGRRFTILPKNHYESIDNRKRKRDERLHGKRKNKVVPRKKKVKPSES